jgi:putative flippase GtrA
MNKQFFRQDWSKQLARFLAVGLTNLVITYAVYLLCLLILPPMFAFLIAVLVALLYTAILNLNFVFERKMSYWGVAISLTYYALYSVAYAGLLHVVISHFGVPPALAPIPVLSIAIPVHFLCSRFLLLRLGPKHS